MATSTSGKRKRTSLRHHFAERIQQLRRARRWSQQDLATLSGLHRTAISLIERARCNVSLDTVERLADAFDISVTSLFSDGDGSHDLAHWASASQYPVSLLERRSAA